ncbi:hypothetical protein NL676_012203 [Syzygium grande]|nr:hypothetical protein NL676_012203 [Syzygium grande]
METQSQRVGWCGRGSSRWAPNDTVSSESGVVQGCVWKNKVTGFASYHFPFFKVSCLDEKKKKKHAQVVDGNLDEASSSSSSSTLQRPAASAKVGGTEGCDDGDPVSGRRETGTLGRRTDGEIRGRDRQERCLDGFLC